MWKEREKNKALRQELREKRKEKNIASWNKGDGTGDTIETAILYY